MMEGILYFKGFHGPIKGDNAKPSNMQQKVGEDAQKNHWCIRPCIDVSVFYHVSQETSSNTFQEKLDSLYERKMTQNKTFAIKKLLSFKLNERISIAKNLSELQDLVN